MLKKPMTVNAVAVFATISIIVIIVRCKILCVMFLNKLNAEI